MRVNKFKFFLVSGIFVAATSIIIACKSTATADADPGTSACTLTDDTTETSTLNTYDCAVLERDVSSCEASRTTAGLTGYWLKFSCRVTLTKSGSNVVIVADSQPDYKSQYFDSTDACYEAFSATGRFTNPNKIAEKSLSVTVPFAPSAGSSNTATDEGVIGVALNGVSLYDNSAAPGDSIYEEADSFDKCQGHPDQSSSYHYHTEPESISQADSAFIGVMRDGYPVYGRQDANGSTPTLDAAGGHTGTTPDSTTAVYHYHANLQTDGTDSAYFLSAGYYHGTKGACTGCL